MKQEDYKIYINGTEIKRATKFKLKRSFWQMIKDKIEFAKNKRKLSGYIFITSKDDEFIKSVSAFFENNAKSKKGEC